MPCPQRLLRWTVTATLAFASTAVAQKVDRPQPQRNGMNPESMYGKESAQGVYVRDSAVALEKFAQAQRMERLNEWGKAADLYQEVLEKFSDRVVPSQVDKDNSIYQYTSVIAAVQQKMSHWPADGLHVYDARYEAAAQAILDASQPNDRAALQSILNKYFATETAKIAGIRLMDLYREAGEFAASAWVGEQLLQWHPSLIVERPRVLYRVALADHLAGDEAKAKVKLEELKAKFPGEVATIRGTDQKLVDALTADLQQPPPAGQAFADASWPMYGGSPSHSRLSTANGRPGAQIYSIELTKPSYQNMSGDQLTQIKQRDLAEVSSGAAIDVMPVVDRGQLFFQDGLHLWAVALDTGTALSGWQETYPGIGQTGQYVASSARSAPHGMLATVTLTDHAVLAIMGLVERTPQNGFGMQGGEGKLVCLNRENGKENWTTSLRNVPEEASALRQGQLTGSPLVVDNNVYVTVRCNKGMQFDDCYVVCLDLETGKYRWNCYISSANSMYSPYNDGEPQSLPDDSAQLAYASGRLYVLTNIGAVAAIDAYGGRIIWLSIYPRDPSAVATAQMGFGMGRANLMNDRGNGSKPWMNSPVFVENGHVFVMPTDGICIDAYDAGTGIEIKRLPRATLGDTDTFSTKSPADSLLAVFGDRLLVASPSSIKCIDWQKFDPDHFNNHRDAALVWPKMFGANARGRAFVTADKVYFPTQEKLECVSTKGGRVLEEYPQFPKTWKDEELQGPGNVLVAEEFVVIAASGRIDVYTDMDAARHKSEQEIAAHPNDPEIRLNYAEQMFNSGDATTAMAKLDEAITVLGGREKMKTGPVRNSIYHDTVKWAQKLGKDIKDPSSENLDMVQQLYDRAAAAASNPSQQVDYRILRARLATTLKDYPGAVSLYQQIIADPELRKVPVMDEASNVSNAATTVIRPLIDDLIKKGGAACYAPFEQQAQEQFTAAKTSNQADALVTVAANYPNAQVAPQALLAAADLHESSGDHRGAVQLLRQCFLTYPHMADKRLVLESMARNYLAMSYHTSGAVARLSDALKVDKSAMLSRPLVLPDGRVLKDVSLAAAVTELKKFRGQEIINALPDFKLPVPSRVQVSEDEFKQVLPFLPESPDSMLSGVEVLLSPAPDESRGDRVVAYGKSRGLSFLAPGANKPLADIPLTETPVSLAWGRQGALIWTTHQVVAVGNDAARAAWTFDLKNLPPIEVVAAVGGPSENAGAANADNNANPDQVNVTRQVIIARNRHMVNGRMMQAAQAEKPMAQVAADGSDVIADVRPLGDIAMVSTATGRLLALDMNDGRVIWQMRVNAPVPQRILADEDFIVLMQRDEATTTLTVLDTMTGQSVGRRTSDPNRMLMNIALSPDGVLVCAYTDRIAMKNLYDNWSAPDREIANIRPAINGTPAFMMCTLPDQLQVSDGRILALADQGQALRVFSMETGKAVRYTPENSSNEVDMVLQSGNTQAGSVVSIRVVGSEVYLIGQQSIMAYNLDKPQQSWHGLGQPSGSPVDTMIGRNHLIWLWDTGRRINAGHVAAYELKAFARFPQSADDNGESGRLEYSYPVSDRSGVVALQAVDGGFYYLSGDQKLHFLRGAGGAVNPGVEKK